MTCVGFVCLLAGLAQTPVGSPEWVPFRVSDAVGAFVDAAARESLGLFPDVTGFAGARFTTGPDSAVYAFVDCELPEGQATTSYRLSPTQVERIRFLADNVQAVRRDTCRNAYAGLAVRRFWSDVELAGSFDGYVPPPVGGKGETYAGMAVWDEEDWDKAYRTLHGATVGSAAGGCAASFIAAEKLDAGGYACGGCALPYHAEYRVNHPLFCGITGGSTVLGVACALGLKREAAADYSVPEASELGRLPKLPTWLTTCAMTVGGVATGGCFVWGAYGALYGRELEFGVRQESGHGWRLVPAIFTGTCIAVELALLGYKWGESTKYARANRAARTGYALNRQPVESDTVRGSTRSE